MRILVIKDNQMNDENKTMGKEKYRWNYSIK